LPDDGLVGDLIEVEQVAASAIRSHPALTVTTVRPAALVGVGVDTVVTRHFEAPRLLTLRDDRMAWQFCHVDDLATAVATCVTAGIAGPVTVGSPGALNQLAVEGVTGMRRIELPSALAFSTAERLHRVGVLPTPASDLSYVVHPWVVGSSRLREAGWVARYDNETCLGVVMKEVRGRSALAARRVGGKDAALGAAGAAVAVVGTAAVWRQARARRRRGGR
jgi:nucleoside-diphosphate-sugar epimerase